MHKLNRTTTGFTIVEVLIVTVVIAILAAISVVAYTNIQARTRDSRRSHDIAEITKALDLYYVDNGRYPTAGGSTTISSNWSTTADASWQNLINILQPYMGEVPSDPTSTPNANVANGNGYNYAYYANTSTYCGLAPGAKQIYLLLYRLESTAQSNTFNGDCSTTPLRPYPNVSNYRVRK
jgi:general secretion pathway protein G